MDEVIYKYKTLLLILLLLPADLCDGDLTCISCFGGYIFIKQLHRGSCDETSCF